jgi:hypothetical protein
LSLTAAIHRGTVGLLLGEEEGREGLREM